MRNYVLHWRRGAMSFVLAAACASSLTTSGCSRSSSRDVSIDLSKQAAESALQTERKIAVRQRELDQSHKEARADEIAGKTFLPSTNPSVTENPLAKLLADRAEKYPSGDPFLKPSPQVPFDQRSSEQIASQAQAHEPAPKVSLTQHVDRVQPIASTSAPSSTFPPQSASPTAKPFPTGIASPSIAVSQPATDFRFVEQKIKKEAVVQAENSNKAPSQKRSASSPERSQKQSGSGFITSSNNSKFEFSSNDLGRWKTIGNKIAPKDSFQAVKSNKKQRLETSISSQSNQQYTRMTTLLAKAKTQQSRGELHSAYRTALLAQNIAEQHKLTIATSEVDPSVFASEIAAKIWGIRSPEKVQPKVPVQSDLPIIRPKRTHSVQHDQVFATPNQYLDWQSFSDQNSQKNHPPREPSRTQPTKVTPDSMTIIANDSHRSRPAPKVQQIAGTIAQEPSGLLATNSQPVSLAFAQLTSSQEKAKAQQRARPMPNQPASAQAPSLVPNPGELRSLPLTEDNETPLSSNTDFFTVQDLSVAPQSESPAANDDSNEAVNERQISSQTNAKWGIVAFILAVISTLIGLKFSGTSSGNSVTSEANDVQDSDDDDRPKLKVSNAA